MTNGWATVAEAARILGTSKQAIRQRIYRDTIEHRKDSEGTVYVRITQHNYETNAESYGESLGETGSVIHELVEELRARISSLENQLEHERRANAEQRRLLAAALERIPAIEPPSESISQSSSDARESPVTASEEEVKGDVPPEPETAEPEPWWRRIFK